MPGSNPAFLRRRRLAHAVPPLPHPSWGRDVEFGEHKLSVATVSAAEFWKRLGL